MLNPKAHDSEPTLEAQRSALVWSLVCLMLATAYFGLDRVLDRFQPREAKGLDSRQLTLASSSSQSSPLPRPARLSESSSAPELVKNSDPPRERGGRFFTEGAPANEEVKEVERPSEAALEASLPEPNISRPSISLEEIVANPNDRVIVQQFLQSASESQEGAIEIEKLKALAIESPSSTMAEEIGEHLRKEGKLPEAMEWYQRALEKNPPNPEELRTQIGISQQVLNRASEQGQM